MTTITQNLLHAQVQIDMHVYKQIGSIMLHFINSQP